MICPTAQNAVRIVLWTWNKERSYFIIFLKNMHYCFWTAFIELHFYLTQNIKTQQSFTESNFPKNHNHEVKCLAGSTFFYPESDSIKPYTDAVVPNHIHLQRLNWTIIIFIHIVWLFLQPHESDQKHWWSTLASCCQWREAMTTYPHRKVDGGKHGAEVGCGERETTHGEEVFHVIVGSPQEGETKIKK